MKLQAEASHPIIGTPCPAGPRTASAAGRACLAEYSLRQGSGGSLPGDGADEIEADREVTTLADTTDNGNAAALGGVSREQGLLSTWLPGLQNSWAAFPSCSGTATDPTPSPGRGSKQPAGSSSAASTDTSFEVLRGRHPASPDSLANPALWMEPVSEPVSVSHRNAAPVAVAGLRTQPLVKVAGRRPSRVARAQQ
jgi:hypothetical protein